MILDEIILRGDDPTGHGHYGAKRGTRKHKGLDVVAKPGEPVKSPINGYISKIGWPYSGVNHIRYIDIKNDEFRHRLMYVGPIDGLKVNDRVFFGDVIGHAQDVAGYWHKQSLKRNPKAKKTMKNHVHWEVYKHGLLTDPEPILWLALGKILLTESNDS